MSGVRGGYMRRFPFVFALAGLVFLMVCFMTACGGSSSVPTSLVVTPNPISLDINPPNNIVQLTPTVFDQNGKALTNFVFTYATSDVNDADVSTGGLVCAGTWSNKTGSSSEAHPNFCTPSGVILNGNQVIGVTAKKGSTTFTLNVPVFTHMHVDTVTITAVNAPPSGCLSQTAAAVAEEIFRATATSNGTDITSQVGDFTWTVTPSQVGSVDTTSIPVDPSCTLTPGATAASSNCIQIAAEAPGVATITASVSGTTSTPATFSTCPIKSIILTGPSSSTSVSLNPGNSATLSTTAIDTNGFTLTNIPFSYNSTAPANVSGASPTTGATPGSAILTASCSPPNCNIGQYPVFSNGLPVTVSGTSSTTVYVAGASTTPVTSPPQIVPISTTSNTVGTAIPIGGNPNSFLMNRAGTTGYIGTSAGLITLTTSSNTVTSPTPVTVGNTNYVGTLLALSPNGTWLVTAAYPQGAASTASTNVVFTNTSTGISKLFGIAGAVSADFSPDNSTAMVLAGDGNLYTFNIATSVAFRSVTAPNGLKPSLVSFLDQGSFAITAGNSATLTPYATCSLPPITPTAATPAGQQTPIAVSPQNMANTPSLIAAVPNPSTSGQVGAVAVSGTTMGLLNTTTNGATPLGSSVTLCSAPTLTDSITNVPFGATINPQQVIVSPDGTKAFVTNSSSSTLFGTDLVSGLLFTPVVLGNGSTATTTGSITPDSATLYVGSAGDNTVHRILLNTVTDAGPISLGVPIFPNYVVVQPH
jgi:hypothetical protein